MSSPAVSPDWSAIARTPQFQELVSRRRRFVVAGTLFYSLYFIAYLALLGFAPDLMAKEVLGSITLALLGRPQHLRADAPVMARDLRAPRRRARSGWRSASCEEAAR